MEVRLSVRSFASILLIFTLLTVLVGNYLSFHDDHRFEESSKITASSQFAKESPSHSDSEKCNDPCAVGFCHLGHCAKLVSATGPVVEVPYVAPVVFKSLVQVPYECFLEGPFQPPRTV